MTDQPNVIVGGAEVIRWALAQADQAHADAATQTPTVVTRAATLDEARALRADLQPDYLHWWLCIVNWPRAPRDAKPYALVLGQRRDASTEGPAQ
jgi:hypothetical protein